MHTVYQGEQTGRHDMKSERGVPIMLISQHGVPRALLRVTFGWKEYGDLLC